MSTETFRQACNEFSGGLVSFSDGKTYSVSQVTAFLDAGGTEEQIRTGALDAKADVWDKLYAAQQMAALTESGS